MVLMSGEQFGRFEHLKLAAKIIQCRTIKLATRTNRPTKLNGDGRNNLKHRTCDIYCVDRPTIKIVANQTAKVKQLNDQGKQSNNEVARAMLLERL